MDENCCPWLADSSIRNAKAASTSARSQGLPAVSQLACNSDAHAAASSASDLNGRAAGFRSLGNNSIRTARASTPGAVCQRTCRSEATLK